MKYLPYFTCLLFISALTSADDTEIYGTDGVSESTRVNPNVLFIMDTSGSMGAEVTTSSGEYDPSATYNQNGDNSNALYGSDKFYHDLNSPSDKGHLTSTLSTSDSQNCSEDITNLTANGRSQGNYKQKIPTLFRTKWNDLLDDWFGTNTTDDPITCHTGRGLWLYSGHYMNWYHNHQSVTVSTRLAVTVEVVKGLTEALNNVNLGLMSFNVNDGGKIDIPVDSITNTRTSIQNKLDSYTASTNTPLTEALYEAGLYFRGDTSKWGIGKSVTGSFKDGSTDTYQTPMEASCQKNHIILFTDGQPWNDKSSSEDVEDLVEFMDNFPDSLDKECEGTGTSQGGGCLDELAYWLYNTKHSDQEQEVTVHTIGAFGLEDQYVALLQNTALQGGGNYQTADSSQQLILALDSIFLKILDTDTTFTAPAVSVNAFNTSEHRDELFYALFQPDDTIKWAGNLKKYKLSADGTVLSKDESSAAINSATGFFRPEAKGFWNPDSNDPDGPDVTLGGMANLLDYTSRTIWTENTSSVLTNLSSDDGATINSFGASDSAGLENLVDWAYGKNIATNNSNRFSIGDPLHSEPVIVTYGGSDENPDSTIFFGTNEGYIHAVDTVSGQEEFAFIPRALHGIQKDYYENSIGASSKPYGMDGSITTWFKDVNDNNVILNGSTAETGEHVYLYAGMRRGGRNYYGLDVTHRNSPTLLFTIEGGTNTSLGNFSKLGETWSNMQVAKVKLAGDDRFVLFFTGGYDVNQDSNTSTDADTMGNAVYMVDATTGALLWSASNTGADTNISDMVNSMPASPSLVDYNGDGFIDYLFTADMGGRVFRFDINQENTSKSNFAEGGMIASIAGSDLADKRRFYNKPNLSLVKDSKYGDYLTIALGSGHRAHPKNTTEVQNRFYVIKDFNPYGKPSSYGSKTEESTSKITLNADEAPNPLKLYNATSFMTGGDTALEANDDLRSMLNNGGGWYVTLSSGGEKVLAESVTFSGAIIFTTFKPSADTNSANSCGANTGEARIYAIDQQTGVPILNLDDDADKEASTLLSHSGIAPRPVVIYREGGGKTIAVGTEAINDSRFESQDPDNCPEGQTCDEEAKCETNNCYVIPKYWRQNDKN